MSQAELCTRLNQVGVPVRLTQYGKADSCYRLYPHKVYRLFVRFPDLYDRAMEILKRGEST